MAPSISGDLSRISKAASSLNRLADEATEQIRALEAHLIGMDLGVSESLQTSSFATGREKNRSGHMMPAIYLLGYDRDDDGKFGLVVEAYVEQTDENDRPVLNYDEQPPEPQSETVWVRRLERVSRELRLAAMPQLPLLVASLAKKAESTIEKVRAGVEETRAVVDELKAALPPGVPLPEDSSDASGNRPLRRGRIATEEIERHRRRGR
jgi:hypothetical protein